MYSIYSCGGMIADHVRMEPYVRALRQAVKPDSVVLDIGTGTGLHSWPVNSVRVRFMPLSQVT